MIITDKAHSGSLVKGLQASFQEQKFCDIKIKCDGKIIKCHRAVLCQFSTVLRSLVSDESTTPETVGVIGMEYCQLESLIKFMYFGRIKVNKEDINTTLKCAEDLGMEALVRFAHDNFKELKDENRLMNESSTSILTPSITNGVDNSARKRSADEMSHQKTEEEDILSSERKKVKSDVESLNVSNNERDRREPEKKVLNSKPLSRNNENNLSNTTNDEISIYKPNDDNVLASEKKKLRNDSESKSNDLQEREKKKSNLEQVPSSRGNERERNAMNITNNDEISILTETSSERRKPKTDLETKANDISEREREKRREMEKSKVVSNKPCPLSKVGNDSRNNLSVSGDDVRKSKVDERNETTEKVSTPAPAVPTMVQCGACKKSYKSNLTHKKLDVSELGADKKCGYDGCSKPVKFKRALIDHLSRDHKIDICNPEEKS